VLGTLSGKTIEQKKGTKSEIKKSEGGEKGRVRKKKKK
jgi:hypothetical protein